MRANITGGTALTGIIGDPIEHTLSPAMQNAAFAALGLDWVYLPFQVRDKDLAPAISGLLALGCRGLNITIPHKTAAYNLMDETAPSAAAIRAVNTVEFRDGRLIGHNTDGTGFLQSLREDASLEPGGKRTIIIGAGGAATSIAAALAGAGAAEIKVLNRTRAKAENLVGLISATFPKCSTAVGDPNDKTVAVGYDLIVNATSVGMESNPGLPLAKEAIEPGQTVYDIIYRPSETELIRLAKERGAVGANGVGMLLRQGAAAFTIWTSLPAPIEKMVSALQEEFAKTGDAIKSAADKQQTGKNINRRQAGDAGATNRGKGG